jgi:hypothetical protein
VTHFSTLRNEFNQIRRPVKRRVKPWLAGAQTFRRRPKTGRGPRHFYFFKK